MADGAALLGNRADADECFQETFTAAVEYVQRSPEHAGQAVRSWRAMLVRLATARAVDRLRQRVLRSSRELGDGNVAALPDQSPRPVERAEQAEMSQRLRDALTHLPPKQADAFCLHCLEGWSYREVAEQLNESVDNVGVLIHRAGAALRERIVTIIPGASSGAESDQVSHEWQSQRSVSGPVARSAHRRIRDEPFDAAPPAEPIAAARAMLAKTAAVAPRRRHLIERLAYMTFTQRLAAVVMITLGALTPYIMFSLFNSLAPSVAFGEIAQKLKNARTLQFTSTVTLPGHPARSMKTLLAEPDRMRTEMADGVISIKGGPGVAGAGREEQDGDPHRPLRCTQARQSGDQHRLRPARAGRDEGRGDRRKEDRWHRRRRLPHHRRRAEDDHLGG